MNEQNNKETNDLIESNWEKQPIRRGSSRDGRGAWTGKKGGLVEHIHRVDGCGCRPRDPEGSPEIGLDLDGEIIPYRDAS